MQMLATAEQFHECAAQLLAQAKQSAAESSPRSRAVLHVAEACAQLQLQLDGAAVQDELQRAFRKRLLLACEKTAEECNQFSIQQQQQQQQQQHQAQAMLPLPSAAPAHKPLIFARHPHVAGGSGQQSDDAPSAPALHLSRAHNVQLQHVPVAEHSWRGRDVDKSSAAFAAAAQIIARAQRLCSEASSPASGFHAISKLFFDSPVTLLGGDASGAAALETLSLECVRLLSSQPMVIRAHGDTKVFGDIHGQLSDLLALFREHGFPSNRSGGDVELASYVFNGDFVDRGPRQVEVVALLFSLKVCFPDRVFLLRGNHEFRAMNAAMSAGSGDGFDAACAQFFGSQVGLRVFESIHSAFDWLPFAGLIENSVLVLHGGIGSGVWSASPSHRPDVDWLDSKGSLRPIRETDPQRPSLLASSLARWTHLHNIVWSDPLEQTSAPSEWQPHYMASARGGVDESGQAVENPIKKFNSAITKAFCERNRISMVIRSHEVKERGYELQHNGRLCTVFSARNYAKAHKNDAALVLLQPDERGRLHCKFKTLSHLD